MTTRTEFLEDKMLTLVETMIENGLSHKLPVFADPTENARRYHMPDGLDDFRKAVKAKLVFHNGTSDPRVDLSHQKRLEAWKDSKEVDVDGRGIQSFGLRRSILKND